MRAINFETLRAALKGRKTYGVAAATLLYLLGAWAGWWPCDEKLLAALGAGGLATLAAKINRQTLPLLLLLPALTGCARFSTTQQDLRYDAGQPTTAITTKASAFTLFSARSDLARWKASQTEKSQGAEVGGLSQQGGTNTAATLNALAELLRVLRP